MLFTRCPECTTTFRVSDEALKRANGQVRCGRCARVFNALTEQVGADTPNREAAAAPTEPAAAPSVRTAKQVEAATPPETPAATEPRVTAIGPQPPRTETAPTPAPSTRAAADSPAANIAATSVADVVAEVESAEAAAADSSTEPTPIIAGDVSAITAEQVEAVLAELGETPLLGGSARWHQRAKPRGGRWWRATAALALLALSLQVINHFRGALAGHPTFGPWTQQAYALVGMTVTPRWDVRQYEILDWVATAEPNRGGVGSLKISARIQNRGPQQQPYPSVQLRLKDRWEKAVGSRMFGPDEYLSRDAPRARLMAAGETARAEIAVVDPGPDAYGFELDVCIEVEAERLTCRTDKVFL
jgi:predicted Zn finger-like uncharacterized protein